MKKSVVIILALLALIIAVSGCGDADTVKYHGKQYTALEYPADIFYYYMKDAPYYEEDFLWRIMTDNGTGERRL